MGPLFSRIPTAVAFGAALVMFHLLFTGLGLGATLILLPRRLSRYVLIFAPVAGFSLTSWLGWQMLWFGAAGTNSSAPIIAVVASAVLVIALVTRSGRAIAANALSRDVLASFAIAACGVLALSVPAVVEPHLTTVSGGNADVASYALTERFLMLHRIDDVPGNITDYFGVGGHIQSTVFGVFFCSAAAGSLFGIESYQLQNVAIAAYVLWTSLALYALAREVFQFRERSALVLVAGFSFNQLVLYLGFQGFKAQFAAMAIAGSLYCWMIPILRQERLPRIRDLAGMTLLTWGLSAAYPHIVPLMFLPPAVYVLALAVQARSIRPLRTPLFAVAIVLTGFIALSPARARAAYQYAILMKNVAAGWFIPWISPASLLGLDLHYFFQRPPWPSTALLALVAAAIVAIGLLATRIANRDVFLVAVSFLVTIGASALYLAITGREGSLLGGYKSFKLVSFFEPALWCSFLLVLREPHPVLSRRRLQQLLAIALVAGNAIAGVRLTKAVAAVHASVSREFSDLQKLEADPRVPSINILSPEFWDNMWETTFLFHKKLYHLNRTYYPQSPLRGEWLLDDRSDRILGVERCNTQDRIVVNQRFTALREGTGVLTAEWDRGWQVHERTHRWTADRAASIRIRSPGHQQIRIETVATPLNPANTVALLVNGMQLAACSGRGECDASATLGEGENVLEFVSPLPPERPGNGDVRELGVDFSKIVIGEANCGLSSR